MSETKDVMGQIHKVNAQLLDEVKSICDEYRIRYFLDAGTLLGAIRHHDFIPWDDDVDVLFPREDFEKFLKLAPQLLGKDYKLLIPGEIHKESFFDFIPKLVYLPSRISKNSPEAEYYGNNLNHIALDLFVFDYAHPIHLLRDIQRWGLIIIYGLSIGHRYKVDLGQYRGISKFIVLVLSKIGRRIPIKTLVKCYFKIAQLFNKHTDGKRIFICNYTFNWISCFFKASWYKKVKKVKLGDGIYSAPIGYHSILRRVYGNYMELPPEESRKPKHMDVKYVKVF